MSSAEPVPEFSDLTELGAVLAFDAPEVAEATELAPESAELAEPVVDAASEASADATRDIWSYTRMPKGTGDDGFGGRVNGKGRGDGSGESGGVG